MLDLLRQRRSVRQFLPRQVETDKKQMLLEAALRAPSSRGRNPWQFILVDDSRLLAQLADCKAHGSAFLGDAPLALVIAADPQVSDVWVEDCSIAAVIVQLAAVSLGLGSCWAQVRLREHDSESSAGDYIKRLLGIPHGLVVECVLGIGYSAEDKPGHPTENLLRNQLHQNRYEKK